MDDFHKPPKNEGNSPPTAGKRLEVEYELIRSRRKTISVQVGRSLAVVVRAPNRMPREQINQFVHRHSEWIARQLEQFGKEASRRAAFHFADGQQIPFAGGTLRIATGERPAISGEYLLLPPDRRPEQAARVLRAEARKTVHERIGRFAPSLSVVPAGVKITSAVTRWGSCSGKNSLSFSYRVACLPERLLDYVVVHELAHIREHNHSDRFWSVVAAVLPDYRERRAALRDFQQYILF